MNKPLSQKDVEPHLGEVKTAKEIKKLFGYSALTYIHDTILWQRKWLLKVNAGYPSRYKIIRGQDF